MGADDVVIKSSDLSELKLKVKQALSGSPKTAARAEDLSSTVADYSLGM
jgi:DNA-binding response OmpR family regulator